MTSTTYQCEYPGNQCAHPSKSRQWQDIAKEVWILANLWYARAQQRHQLAALSPEQLLDVGITSEQAEKEAAKPFWRS